MIVKAGSRCHVLSQHLPIAPVAAPVTYRVTAPIGYHLVYGG
jgi:hypothetical protein